ncbi:MAG: glycosidase, partial [Actinobacteria bacterium]|nr:glycosidase [Actinomycetota bacterium]
QPEQQLSERILFPAPPTQRNGIEDARFVCFKNEDGSCIYYATFTAFDGRVVMPELVETSDFLRFRFITLNGPAAQKKGMALFPRRINGHYAMLS